MCNILIIPINVQGHYGKAAIKRPSSTASNMQISYRYIEMNQVRAGMVRHPAEYPWSSYRMNAFGKHDNMTTPHPLYHALGETEQKRREVYSALIGQQLNETSLKAIREATNKAWVLKPLVLRKK